MRIGIVGPGAMGCLLAGMMARAGNEVMLLDHEKERVEIINRDGLTIEGLGGTFRIKVPATLVPNDLSSNELIINCVKAYDTKTVAQVLQIIEPGPYFLTLQNGVGNIEILGETLPKEKILGRNHLSRGHRSRTGSRATCRAGGYLYRLWFPGNGSRSEGKCSIECDQGNVDPGRIQHPIGPQD